jgi:hypothetical protein
MPVLPICRFDDGGRSVNLSAAEVADHGKRWAGGSEIRPYRSYVDRVRHEIHLCRMVLKSGQFMNCPYSISQTRNFSGPNVRQFVQIFPL